MHRLSPFYLAKNHWQAATGTGSETSVAVQKESVVQVVSVQ